MSYVIYKWLVAWRTGSGYTKRRFTAEQVKAAWAVYYSKRKGRDCAIFRLDAGRWYRVAGFGNSVTAG